jgi:hypothetical protein
MRSIWWVLVLMAAPVFAQTRGDDFKALEAAYVEAEGGYVEKYKEFQPRFEAFAKANAGTEEGLSAKLWLLNQTWWLRDDGKMESTAKALVDEILAEYADSEQLAKLPDYQYVFAPKDRDAVLERLEQSPHASVRAAALYQRASRATDEEKAELLQRLAREYGELRFHYTTYGALADAMLNAHPAESLAIGQPAPDIVGVDVDGKAMKLSDYRGKVVVLDFWGDW